MEETESIGKREQKIKTWLKDNYTIVFLAIFIAAIIIRIYYFIMTANQPVWWDEAEYLSTAKHWAFNFPYIIAAQRAILLPALIALLYKINLTEPAIKFITVIIPSIILVWATYLVGKIMYDKKVGLIASAIITTFWLLMFNSMRFHTDAITLLFALLSIYFFWKYYVKTKSSMVWLAGLFLALGFIARPATLLLLVVYAIFIILTEHWKLFKLKETWILGASAIIFTLPYLIFNQIYHGKATAFTQHYSVGITNQLDLAWHTFNVFFTYHQWLLFIFFIIGLGTLWALIIGFDLVIKRKNKKYHNDLFTIILLLLITSFFVFYIRSPSWGEIEPRWVLIMAPFMFFITAKGLLVLYEWLAKYKKIVGILAIVAIIIITGYSHLSLSDTLIKGKLTSYQVVKDSGLWLKQNTESDEIIISASYPQHTFYTERTILNFPGEREQFSEILLNNNIKYMVFSVVENHPSWVQSYVQEVKEPWTPVQAYAINPGEQQAVLVVFELDKSKL